MSLVFIQKCRIVFYIFVNLFPDAVFFAGMGERVFFELSGIIIEEITVQYVADAH